MRRGSSASGTRWRSSLGGTCQSRFASGSRSRVGWERPGRDRRGSPRMARARSGWPGCAPTIRASTPPSRPWIWSYWNNLHPDGVGGNFRRMADLSNLLQLGQQMQFRLSEIQSQLAQQTVTCTAGGGMVQATADGRGQIRSIKIDPQAVSQGDVEMLEALVLAAVADAQKRAAEIYQAEMSTLATGLPLPIQLPLTLAVSA